MNTEDINWGFNCLTMGVHHGRPEEIWNIPLGYAVQIYARDVLEEMVVSRIYNDAMQMVEHGVEPRPTKEWADRVKELARERFEMTLDDRVRGLSEYYDSRSWAYDTQDVAERIGRNKLNPNYAPLHSHDSINQLCRMVGVGSSIAAAKGE
jgi:hypothetical protein